MRAALRLHESLAGVDAEEVIGSRDLFGYRNGVKLAVRAGRNGTLRAGVYAPGTHRLVEAEHCAAQHPALGEVVCATLEAAAAAGIRAYDERDGSGELRYLVARYSALQRRVLLALVTALPESGRLRELARQLARQNRSLGGVVHNYNPDRGNVILGRLWATLRPPSELTERIGFLLLRASPAAFVQPNVWTARRIYETVLEWANPGAQDRVLDLFCGIGPLSLYLATRAGQVIGIEEATVAVRDARANQGRNRVHNVRFEEGRVDDVLLEFAKRGGHASIVTLNPTRKGASPLTVSAVAALAPRCIVYVSCDVDTLARDLDRFASLGYETRRVRAFDMLPQTEHVETVSLLAPRSESQDAR